jgi:hypothetical protein
MSSQVKIAEQKKGRWLLPVVGFILMVALTAIAYVIAPDVEGAIRRLFPQFTRSGMSAQTFRWVLTGITAFILLSAAMMVVAFGSRRKRPLDVTNDMLVKEREAMIRERKRAKLRQRRMNQKFRDYVKENQKFDIK